MWTDTIAGVLTLQRLYNIYEECKEAARFNGKEPLSIRCDNSRDLEIMNPSNLSGFNVCGGLYRYVQLVYLPKVSLKSVRLEPTAFFEL